jgi:hypothetical protein
MSNVITPKEGEKVLLNLRKSIFTYGKQMLVFGLILVLVALVAIFLYQYVVVLIIAGVLLFAALGYAFYYFLIWFYDVYIITNIRLVSVSKKGLFHSDYSEVEYGDVTNVTYQVHGFFATLFQYGTVMVTGPEIMQLTNLPDPGEILETLKALVAATKQKIS